MTVLFADIRNFTAISEELSPGESFDFLNAYLNRIGPIVREHGGFIDKYIGDSVMALFPAESDAALDAALAVQREVRAFSGTLRAQGKPGIAVGVGLHTGRLMLGTIGERARMETTVISDAVNLASRMESATKIFGAGIVMSEETFAHLARPQNYLVRSLGKLTVRGKRQPVSLYEAYGADAPEIAVRKEASVAQFADAVCRYEEGDWRTAGAAFAELHRLNKDDEVARYFRNRCDALMESSGAGNWDGIERVQAN
jgi:two-component system sensor histidine kinase ChiS